MISNSQSLYNQQIVLATIQKISQEQKSISFSKLNELVKENDNLDLDEQTLGREIEILILRSMIEGKIEGNELIF